MDIAQPRRRHLRALSELAGTRSAYPKPTTLQQRDLIQAAIFLRLIQPVRDDELVWNVESDLADVHRPQAVELEAGTITATGHPGDDLLIGALNSILKKAGLKR
ncbi:MAG: hypothetical protein ACLQKA_03135 [Bryobacteraceae bacterium]